MDFDLSQGKNKKRQPRERRLVVHSTFMLPEQKLYLHENQTGKGIKHGDFEARFSLIPWEAQKSGSHRQLPVSLFQPYFQRRLEFFATTFGSYSPFLEREAYGNAWQSLRFCSPEVVNTITTSSSPESAPASSQGQPQISLQSAQAVLSKALQDPRFFLRRFAGCLKRAALCVAKQCWSETIQWQTQRELKSEAGAVLPPPQTLTALLYHYRYIILFTELQTNNRVWKCKALCLPEVSQFPPLVHLSRNKRDVFCLWIINTLSLN